MSAISGWLKMSKELQELTFRSVQRGFVLEIDESGDAHKEALRYFKYVKGGVITEDSPFEWRIRKSTSHGEWTWLFAVRDDLVEYLRGRSFEEAAAA